MSLTLGIIASSRGNIVPPLDTYGGAAAAYSTRLLSSAYGGSAVRVRRSFDNAEQDIGFSGGAIDETALMNFVGYQNLLQRSEEFNDAYWAKIFTTVTPDTILSPINTLTADSVFETTANTTHGIQKSVSVTLGQSYNFSCYVRPINGREGVVFRFGNGSSDGVIGTYISSFVFTFSSETFSQFDIADLRFQKIGDWYRISCSVIPTAVTLSIAIWDWNGSAASYTGDPTKGLYLWGAQLSTGTALQPYQVTTSAARSGDGFVTKWYTQDGNGENLLLQSQTFDDVYWTKQTCTVSANVTTDPFGGSNADKILETGGAAQNPYVIRNGAVTPVLGSVYNLSCYLKASERQYGFININNNSIDYAHLIDLSTGLSVANLNNPSYSVVNAGNGWWRLSISLTINNTSPITVVIGPKATAAFGTYNTTLNSGIFIYGAQLSQSTWLQPYQVTTTTAILRRDASQSTAANQPRIVGGGVIERENGKPTMFFDGVDDILAMDTVAPLFNGEDIPLSVFSLVNVITAGSLFSIARSNNNNPLHIPRPAGTSVVPNQRRDDLATLVSVIDPFSKKGAFTYAHMFSGTVLSISNNDTDTVTASPMNVGALTGLDRASIGGLRYNASPNGSSFTASDISELILYPTYRYTDRNPIQRNIGAYYQTQWTGASSGLLDQFGGAAAAYSLRNLSSSYRGPLIRVRRSSDNAETDIGGTYNGDLDVASLVSFTGGQNLLTNSEDFTQTAWIKTGTTVTANATIAPDGTLTADKFNETAVNSGHSIGFNTSSLINGVNTISIYIKAAEVSKCLLTTYLSSSPYDYIACNIDLSTASIQLNYTGGAYSVISSSIQSVGNGWYRVSITGNITKGGSPHVFQFSLLNNSYQQAYLGTAGSGVYIWGAQLNTGILQPYIPTTTAAVNGANAFVTKWYTQDNNYQNLVLQSQTFENASWLKTNVSVTQDVAIAPDGSSTADKLISTGLNGFMYQNSASFPAFGNNSASINLNDGTVSAIIAGSFDTIGTTSVGNGWWRIYASKLGYTFSYYAKKADWDYTVIQLYTLTGNNGVYIYPANAPNVPLGNGGGTQGIFIWGAQVNEGSVAQPYTATTTTVSQRRDAIQATAASQPRIVNAGGVESEGNRPAVFWTDGSGMRLTASFPAIPSPQTFFAVNRIGATSGILAATLFDSYNDVQNVYYFKGTTETPNNVFSYADGTVLSGPANPIPVQNITNVIHDTVVNVYDNNILTITGSVGTNSLSGLSIGGLRGNPSPIVAGYDWFGDIQELLVYPSNLATRLAVNSNINSYYQIYWQGNGTALLDNYSGASAAYSLRNLSSAYTGPLIRVRRSNDNVERDIYGTFGGDLDIASLVAFVGANSGFVTTWYDQSGSARHATQTTAANQPRIVNAGVVDTENGKPAIFFDGTNDQLIHTTPTPTASTPYSVHAVVSSLTQTSYRGVFSLGLATSQGGMMMLSRLGISPNWGTYNATSMDIPSTQNIQSAGIRLIEMYGSFAVGTHNFYTNGSSSGTYSDSEGQNVNSIGGVNSPTSQTFNGDISEIIYYNADRTASRIPIESNINNYYKIY